MPTMTSPTRDQFIEKAKQGNLIPVWREVLADMETPVSAFRKIAGGRPNSFLLESVEGGERLARYSFLGSDPFMVFRSKSDTATITEGAQVETLTLAAGERDPLHVLQELLGRYTYVPSPELPPFVGGAVGMIGYDTVRFFEKLPTLAVDDLGLDDCLFLFTDALLIFDNVKHKILALCNARIAPGEDAGAAYDTAAEKVGELLGRLRAAPPAPNSAPQESRAGEAFVPNRTEVDYKAAVLRAKEYIAAGDTFQAQIGQRLSKTLHADPFDVYRALRSINPSPYMFYLDLGTPSWWARRRRFSSASAAARSPSGPSPGHGTGAARRLLRMTPSLPTCSPTRRSGPSTLCWWTWPATTSDGSPSTAQSALMS